MVKTCPALVPIPLRGVGVVLNFVHLNLFRISDFEFRASF